ncbi:MAG: LSM domain-containing protein [Promethearchaeia archaeon]
MQKDYRNNKRPIDYLKESINKVILLKVKRNRLFRATLLSFDEHLNLFLRDASQIFEYTDDDGSIIEETEDIGTIVMRGDNIIFVCLADESQ